MNMQPVSNPYQPLCHVTCCRCGAITTTGVAAADLDGDPFQSYYCTGCQPQPVRDAVSLASAIAFRILTPAQKHVVRVQLYGPREAREIREREARNKLGRW